MTSDIVPYVVLGIAFLVYAAVPYGISFVIRQVLILLCPDQEIEINNLPLPPDLRAVVLLLTILIWVLLAWLIL
jgi:hypothetical protein